MSIGVWVIIGLVAAAFLYLAYKFVEWLGGS